MGYLEIWALTRYLMILMSYHYFLGVRMALSFRALNISDEMICCPRTGLHNNTEGESEWVQRSVVLQVCFLTSSIGSTWELENANSQVPPQTYWIRLLGGPSNLWFNKPPRLYRFPWCLRITGLVCGFKYLFCNTWCPDSTLNFLKCHCILWSLE